MLIVAVVAGLFGLIDAVQSVILQRGAYLENGLPATPRRSLIWGPHPTALQLLGGALGAVLWGLFLGEVVAARLIAPHWHPILYVRAVAYVVWLGAETWMVLRNWIFLRRG
jgi:hypothetical protein